MLNANTYVTSQEGIGGSIRNQYEDFYVEEIPEIIPTGEGPNVWVWIEKVGRTTLDVVSSSSFAEAPSTVVTVPYSLVALPVTALTETARAQSKSATITRLIEGRNTKKVIQTIKNAGGIAILAHPACYWCINLDKFVKSCSPF